MAGFEKNMSCLEPITDLNLELHYRDQLKNQANQSQSQPNPKPNPNPKPKPKPKLYSNYDDRDQLLLQQAQKSQKPKLIPQRRKFATLAKAGLANYEVNYYANIDNSLAGYGHIDRRSSVLQKKADKVSDLVAEGTELGLGEGGEAVGMVGVERKKLLVQLAGNPVVGQSKSQKNYSSLLGNNPSRICRFCSREFPSGRALGGHMRVHGASLVADMEQEKQKQKQKQLNLGSDLTHSTKFNLLGRRRSSEDESFRTQIKEREKARSSSSEMNSEGRKHHQRIKHEITLNHEVKLHQETAQEEEGEHRMVNLSSFELLGDCDCDCDGDGDGDCDGDVSSDFFTGKRNLALYELRRNPKPNQRFIRDQEFSLTNPIWPANYHANHTASLPAGARRSISPSPERARPCSECGKVFSSWKALFGHMRCHPEREWRGIQRPGISLELERTARLITRRPSSAELSYGDNNNNCELAGIDVENREEIRQQEALFKMALQEEEEEAAAGKASPMTQKGGMGSAMEPKEDTAMKTEQAEDRKQGLVSNKAECIIKRHRAKRAADIVLLREVTDDWTPTWPTGKRSRRRRAAQLQQEATLTSETTPNELRLDRNRSELKDQEDLDMANCLVLLSSAGKNIQEVDRMCMESTEESAFSNPCRKQRPLPKGDYSERALGDGGEAEDHGHDHDDHDEGDGDDDDDDDEEEAENRVATLADDEVENHGGIAPSARPGVKYQCSTCKKCFNSHQALGGHRASHRKMKGCFARMKNLTEEAHESGEENITEEDFLSYEHIEWQMMRHGGAPSQLEEERTTVSINPPSNPSKKKLKGHECSICHRIFPSGQALGGHKRCHWTGERIAADTASVASSNNNSSNCKQPSLREKAEWGSRNSSTVPTKMAKEDAIDLNLPAPLDEDDEIGFDVTQGAPAYGRLLSNTAKGEQIAGSLMECPGRRRELNGVSGDWTVKDLLGGTGESSLLQAAREIEARCRFDGRPPMWNQQWNNAAVAQIPQVCSMQPL